MRDKFGKFVKGHKQLNTGRTWIKKGDKLRLGMKHTLESKEKMSLSKNPNWKGESVSYRGLHKRVNRELGQPDTCEFCGKSGLFGQKIHWANKSRKYKTDLLDWIRLCVSCHSKYDDNGFKKGHKFFGRNETKN